MGIPAEHLITCSFMAAPASLAVSKLFYPETEKSKTTINDIKVMIKKKIMDGNSSDSDMDEF